MSTRTSRIIVYSVCILYLIALWTLVGFLIQSVRESSRNIEETQNSLPLSPYRTVEVSAYTADPRETDSTPTVMASGKTVYVGAVANNWLPFGTVVTIGGREYVVEDRMNRRYPPWTFDVFMEDYGEARKWGRRELTLSL
jgi:3D (Asp-Asp-Asp) domain-containing protein